MEEEEEVDVPMVAVPVLLLVQTLLTDHEL